jgi:hypothetical protein
MRKAGIAVYGNGVTGRYRGHRVSGGADIIIDVWDGLGTLDMRIHSGVVLGLEACKAYVVATSGEDPIGETPLS